MSGLMSLGIRALAANYAALQTTGHNIANANVAGYSAQTVQLATSQGQFTGAGYYGRGVDVMSVTRAHNEYLTREAANYRSLAGMDSARLDQLRQMENVFRPGETGLGSASSDLFNAISDLATRPDDLATRQVVVARAGDLAARFNEAGVALDQAQANTTAKLEAAVSQINNLARSIAAVNQSISSAQGLGQPPNDLLDKRDELIAQLSAQVQVTRIDAADGTTSLFVSGGERLVLGNQATALKVVADPADPTRAAVALAGNGENRVLHEHSLGGGSIAGLLRFQNTDLMAGRNMVGRLAAALGTALNQQQQQGLSLQPPLGSVQGSAMFALGAPRALANAANARDALGVALGSVTLTRTDGSALEASEYDLRESPSAPGAWQLTRLSDGKVSTVNSGDIVDGVQIDINNPQPGDRFLLQPVARAANGMHTLLTDPRDIAAASPVVAVPEATNLGTASVSNLRVTTAPLPFAGSTETLTFNTLVPPVGGFNYTVTSSLNGSVVPWNTGDAVVGANGFTLQLGGVPANGDVVTVRPTPSGAMATNNGNAASLQALRDATVVGGRTASDAWAQALSDVGVRVQSSQAASDISTSVATQAVQLNTSQSGVNLDEEAARLIQFQQSYQAAAKMLQVAQTLFDTLMQKTSG